MATLLTPSLGALADRFAGERVLVTGGAGFIGSHLASVLSARGAEVRVLDDLSTGSEANIPLGVRFHRGDVADPRLLDEALDGVERVLHLAAMVSVPQSVAEPESCMRINAEGTGRLVDGCLAHGVGSLVLASTCAVYGSDPRRPSREVDPPAPASPYAESKLAAEKAIARGAAAGLHAVSLRLFNVYGPRQDPRGPYAAAISAFTDAALAGRTITIHGDGRQTRDFVSVLDVAQGFLRALDPARATPGAVVNVGSGVEVEIRTVAETILRASGRPVVFESTPARVGDVRHSCADISLAREVLGYEPTVGLEDGIGRLLASISA